MSALHLVVQGEGLDEARLASLCAVARGKSIEKLSDKAFRLRETDPATGAAVAAHCAAASLDWAWVADGRRLADFGLLALDMDSTLITIECIDEIADFAGRKAEVAALTARAMRGEIDWSESFRRRVSALAGLEEGVLEHVYRERLKLAAGAQTLLDAARRCGLRTLLVSGGFTYFTDRLRERLKLDEAHANRLLVKDGRIAGSIVGPVVGAAAKAAHVVRMREALRLPKARVLVIGDGANDLAMMSEAGTSIAFHAKALVRERATYALAHVGLEGVLNLFPA